MSSDAEDTFEVMETAPAAPRSKRTEISSHLKERIIAMKVRALTAKAGERPATMAATPNQLTHEKVNAQIKVLTDLVKLLLRTIEEQKEEHVNQLKALTKTFT